MAKSKVFKNFLEREVKNMKLLSLLFTAVLVLALPLLAQADISLTVNATVNSGTSLGTHTLLKCTGYSYNPSGDPWVQCSKPANQTTLDFGTLTTRLFKADGSDDGGAGCFYGRDFYIVYLYPDAWGGNGYDLKQEAGTFSPEIQNSVVMTPVYSPDDKYLGQSAQGDLNPPGTTGEVLGSAVLAKNGGSILIARRPRIVRAEYGIPPFPETGESRPASWEAVPLTTPGGLTYSGSVKITLTELH